eukprot:11196194-Lingulodinium_polyedra.AAC.1
MEVAPPAWLKRSATRMTIYVDAESGRDKRQAVLGHARAVVGEDAGVAKEGAGQGARRPQPR